MKFFAKNTDLAGRAGLHGLSHREKCGRQQHPLGFNYSPRRILFRRGQRIFRKIINKNMKRKIIRDGICGVSANGLNKLGFGLDGSVGKKRVIAI